MLLLASVFAFITMIHYTTRTDDPRVYFVHVVFQNLYLLPIVFSAYWFGLRGGVLAAVLSTCLYLPHVTLQWSGSAVEKADQLGALAVFLLVGLAAGMLSSMEKSERARADRTEERSQRRAIALALTTLERALKARDDYTRQHSERTAQLAAGLARRLGLDEAACEEVWLAALMHDVGKIGVRDDILLKPDMLTDEELGMIKRHPSIAEEILRPIKGIDNVVSVVYAHHENFDGSGYPRGLRGDEIPLGAQILATADTFCALTDDRVYRKHEEISGALREMDKMAGKKLNPAILEEFKKMIGEQSEL
ncbi:MAG: HD domain-containing protein [Candidatus Lindowbacteria bacterium]|nr:HD domain-containing protein [Candidatus Lindowbacteria bacterium]